MDNKKSKIKKIFMVGPTESILTRRGNRHPTLAKIICDEGYDLEYITSNFYHAEKTVFSDEEIKQAQLKIAYKLTVFRRFSYTKNISVRRVFSTFFFSLKTFIYLLPKINNQMLLILPSRPVELVFFSAMLRIFKGNSVLVDIQDVWPDALKTKNLFKKIIFTIYCNFYLYLSLRWIDKFVHVTPSFIQWLHRYAPKAESIFIPLGYDKDRWSIITSEKIGKVNRPIELVYIGMLQYQIDILPVVQAISGRPDYRLTIIGDNGVGERYGEVARFIEQNRMTNVEFRGFLDPSEVPAEMMKMDIGLIPIISSLIPNKFFDYLASFLPIIVLGETNDCALLVKELDVGWVCPYNTTGVTNILNSLNEDVIIMKRKKILALRDRYERKNLFKSLLEIVNC